MLLNEIQNNQFFTTYKETKNWLDKMKINNYIIDSKTLEVNVRGDVDLSFRKIKSIPIKFKYVNGFFKCEFNDLTSLQGAPDRVERNCWFNNNQLTSLQGGPSHVGGNFACGGNNLTSLQGCPACVGGYFDCIGNNLTSLEGAPEYVGGSFSCSHNNITSLEGCPPHLKGTLTCNSHTLLIATITKFIKSAPRITLLNFPHDVVSFMWAFRIKSLKEIELYGASDEQKQVVDIINKHLKRDRSGPACQIELIDAGLGKYIKI